MSGAKEEAGERGREASGEPSFKGRVLGYARVSTDGQALGLQVEQLRAAGAERVFRETASGAKRERARLGRLLRDLGPGDVVLVTRLERLARSTRDLLNTWARRQPGRRNGPLSHVALEVLELLGKFVSHRTGRLEPSLDVLMAQLRRSWDAIVRAHKALRTHGFLDWLRRYEPTGRTEGAGPWVRQVSNACRLCAPFRALHLLGWLGEAPRLPDDAAQADSERAAELAAHRAGLPPDELALLEVGNNPSARVLAELGRKVQERESARRLGTLSGKTP